MQTSSNIGAEQPTSAQSSPDYRSPYLLACACWRGLLRAPEPCLTCRQWFRLAEFRRQS